MTTTGFSKPPFQVVQIQMAANNQNLAGGVQVVQWGVNPVIDDDWMILNPNHTYGIQGGGRLMVSGAIALTVPGNNPIRNNIQFQWQKFSGSWSNIGPLYRSNYIRRGTGHNESSQEFPGFIIELDDGELIRMASQRVSGGGGTERADIQRSFLTFLKL